MSRPRLDLVNRREKVRLRLWTLGFWRQETVLDLYAGEGNLSRLYAPRCERLICVEKDGEVFKSLHESMRGFENVSLINRDNMEFLEELNEPCISFVDFDAYGCPNRQIGKFFEKYPVERAIMVNVTDGTLLNLSRLATIDLEEHYLVNLFPKGYLSRRNFDSKRGLRRLLPWLQRTFINLLAAKHGFSTSFIYHAMNREANVTYYGFIAYPDIKTSLWAMGKTSLINFKKDEESVIKTLMRLVKREREDSEFGAS